MERVNHPEMLFGELSRRRHERLDSCFGGGVPDAPALERRKVRGLTGACRYALKPPLGAATYYRSAKGSPFAPVRDLTKAEHFFLWRHLHGLTFPELAIAGGEEVRVHRRAQERVAPGRMIPSGAWADESSRVVRPASP